MKVLVIDIGGNNVKLRMEAQDEPLKIPSGPTLTGQRMVEVVRAATAAWQYDVVTIGYPGPVIDGRIATEPVNLGPGWVGFDFAAALHRPVKLINDAAMQALGSYEGGKMLFLGLGTGLGSCLIASGVIVPMELGHLPYRKATFETYVGKRGLLRLGKKKWRFCVNDVVARLRAALLPEYIVLGGGNIKKLKNLPEGARAGENTHAFLGGLRLWQEGGENRPPIPSPPSQSPTKGDAP
jgi:polyphosphate glucokinase